MLVAGLATSPVAVHLLDEDDRSVLRVQGELTAPVAAGVRSVVGDLLRAELVADGPIVLDMVAVERAHLDGMEVLSELSQLVRRSGRVLLLRNLRLPVRHMRHLMQLEQELPLEDD
jgi:anti-anti-sigma regulatory factor